MSDRNAGWVELDTSKSEGAQGEVEIVKQEESAQETVQEDKGQGAGTGGGTGNRGAEDRIRKLIRERKAVEGRLQETVGGFDRFKSDTEKQIAELREAIKAQQTQSGQGEIQAIRAEALNLQGAIKKAKEDGNVDAEIKAISDLQLLNIKWADVHRKQASPSAKDTPREQTREEPQRREPPPIPAATRDWLDSQKDWWNTNRPLTAAAVEISRELEAEGFEPDDPSYYTELDQRLNAFKGAGTSTPARKESTSQTPRQTMGGGSRSPPQTGNKITLSAEERRKAKMFGITDLQYAKNKMRIQQSRQGDSDEGYTDIEVN